MIDFGDQTRGVFSGVFDGATHRSPELAATLSKDQGIPLALLHDVKDAGGRACSDHTWYPYWGAFELAQIQPGQRVQFLASPTPYMKSEKDREWWKIGFSQLCWVQSMGESLIPTPVFAPPQSSKEASKFLSMRLHIAQSRIPENFDEWGIRVKWNSESLGFITALIESGWASFAPREAIEAQHHPKSAWAEIFRRMGDLYPDRTIQQYSDIAAWCNAGFPAWEAPGITNARQVHASHWAMLPASHSFFNI